MFSTTKNRIFNTFGILCIPQNVWPRKGLIFIYFSPSRQHVTWKHLSIQISIQQWFYDEQGANFFVTRNNFGHLLICWWVILFLSYWGQEAELGLVVKNCFFLLGSWVITHVMKMYFSWCMTILWYTCQIRKFGKLISIPSNTKLFRRNWITPPQKQPPGVF